MRSPGRTRQQVVHRKEKRRLTQAEREASITTKLIRSIVIVAAQRGFYEAQKNI